MKSFIKFKHPVTKKRNKVKFAKLKRKLEQKLQKKLEKQYFNNRLSTIYLDNYKPNIYIINAHSSECYINDIDNIKYEGTLKPIKILEKVAKNIQNIENKFLRM